MSAQLAAAVAPAARAATQSAVVLLGTGVVGGAFLKLLDTPAAAGLRLVGVANSQRQTVVARELAERGVRDALARGGAQRDDRALLAALDDARVAHRVIIDATASDEVAARHAAWLGAGYDVVTANKAALGGGLDGWHALERGQCRGGRYGISATVGAGLPAVATARRLRACGDAVRRIEGVFSGSLSWLFSRYDGSQPFSQLLREALDRGYTEPDPRADLAGIDVARKLLILARSAGFVIGVERVAVENLVPPALKSLSPDTFLARAHELDAVIAARHAEACAHGGVLRHLACFEPEGRIAVGLRIVPPNHPAAQLEETDNLFAFTSARYNRQPLVIRGPGAGAAVTAQALLGDVLALSLRP